MKNNSALFYTCSLIEFIGRKQKQKRSFVVTTLGKETIQHIYDYADVLHCELIERVAYEFIEQSKLKKGDFDNEKNCRYTIPDYWTIGEVYQRLIEDVCGDDIIKTLIEVYTSWIDEAISNYNSDFYYQPRDYIAECYRQNEIIE